MASVLHRVVLNNSHEDAPNTTLETSGFPSRSCYWEKSLTSHFFMGICHSCPHSLFNVPAVTPRSRYFHNQISMAQGALQTHPRKGELCQIPRGWCPPALHGSSSSASVHRDALEETSPQLQRTVLPILIPRQPSFPALHALSAARVSWHCWDRALQTFPRAPTSLFFSAVISGPWKPH